MKTFTMSYNISIILKYYHKIVAKSIKHIKVFGIVERL